MQTVLCRAEYKEYFGDAMTIKDQWLPWLEAVLCPLNYRQPTESPGDSILDSRWSLLPTDNISLTGVNEFQMGWGQKISFAFCGLVFIDGSYSAGYGVLLYSLVSNNTVKVTLSN